jgi:DNA-directed RNA polymerase subunit RPC12/RpoP
MRCDKCGKRRGTIITGGGYLLCKHCDEKLRKATAFERK